MNDRNLFKLKFKKSDYPSRLLLLYLSQTVILTIARFVLTRMGFETGLFRNAMLTGTAAIPIILFLIRIQTIKGRVYISFFMIYTLVVATFLITWLCHPEYSMFLTRMDYGLVRVFRPDCAIYAYLFFSLLDEPLRIFNTLKLFAYIDYTQLIIIQLLPALSKGYWEDVDYLGNTVQRAYSLSFGYDMLLPAILFLYFYLREKNKITLILSLVGFALILTNGSRGALVIPIIFISLLVISNILHSKNVSRKTAKIIGIIFLGVVVTVFGNMILSALVDIASSIGLESRTLQMLASGDFSNDSGRALIWDSVISAIQNGGILGYGAYGDRQFVYRIHYVGYSHNIFLELICSFGIIGIIICVFLIVQSIRMIGFCKNKEWRELFIIFFSISCQLFLSLSLWYVFEFWAATAIAHKYFQLKKLKRIE